MKNKLFALIASIVMIVLGCVVSYFAKFEAIQIGGFALTMFGAGLAVNQLWNSRAKEAKTWLVVLGIILIGLGSFIAGLCLLMDAEQVKTLISLVFALIVFIAGLVVTFIGNKTAKKLD